MTLHDMIQADAAIVFNNVNDFAETVVYYNRTGAARCFSANVFRDPIQILGEDGDHVLPSFEVHVDNNSTTGIASDELNLGGDSLAFAIRVGQERSRRTITKLLGHDEGMLILECR